jgi:xanthine dehydrogenase YagR molybdenum-binding subunit
MLIGRILRSPHPKARIKSVDLEPAKRMAGVRAAMTIKEAGALVRFAGDEVAAIAAESPEIAEEAVRAIRVEYEPMPFVVKEDQARKPEAPKVLGNDRPNAQTEDTLTRGDVAKAFAEAGATAEGSYHVPQRVHACLETHGHVVAPLASGALKVWSSTQAVHGTADEFASIAEMPKDRVEVVCEYMGGGFGSKFGPGVEGRTAYQLAKLAGAPVKLMLDRHEESMAAGSAPSANATLKLAAAKDGTFTAAQGRGYGTGGIGGGGFELPYGLYQFPNVDRAREIVRVNAQPSNAMRAPGRPQSSFITESVIDDLAYALGMDPMELRLKNNNDPLRRQQYEIGAERIGWKQNWNPKPGAQQSSGPLRRGVGVAGAVWGGRGGNPDMKAQVAIANDGSIVVRVGTQDLGTGVRTFLPAIVADELGPAHGDDPLRGRQLQVAAVGRLGRFDDHAHGRAGREDGRDSGQVRLFAGARQGHRRGRRQDATLARRHGQQRGRQATIVARRVPPAASRAA